MAGAWRLPVAGYEAGEAWIDLLLYKSGRAVVYERSWAPGANWSNRITVARAGRRT